MTRQLDPVDCECNFQFPVFSLEIGLKEMTVYQFSIVESQPTILIRRRYKRRVLVSGEQPLETARKSVTLATRKSGKTL